MSRHDGTTFSTPITVTSTSGSVVHIRPLPSDSKTQTLPVSATAKFAPLTPIRADRNFARRCSRAASASAAGSSVRSVEPQLAPEDVADLGAIAVDRRDEDVRGEVVVELDDQLGEIGLDREDAVRGERLVQPISSVAIDFTFTTSSHPVRAGDGGDDRAGLIAVARPVHRGRRRRARPTRAA